MISIELYGGPTPVYGDRSQIHQLILNLCVNARDAMMDRDDGSPVGGILGIATDIAKGSGMKKRYPGASEDEYIALRVSDTGKGMDEETRRRIFEPFFTTKPQGKGTGLGLSTVYGIVQNHAGIIDVESEPGSGTAFTVYLPVRRQAVIEEILIGDESDLRGGNETILVVEDEPGLREYLEDLLTAEGYRVLTAQDGEKAISVFMGHDDIDLVLSDIGLPKIGGIDLMEAVRTMKPGTGVILASGYLDESERRRMAQKGVASFIQKPYQREELLKRIRSALDRD
jgi:CheY-like chemotaxis protein